MSSDPAAGRGALNPPCNRAEQSDAELVKALYRTLTAGVAVVTVDTASGPHGMTASSVTAVSLDPPLVLLSLSPSSRTLAAIADTQRFAVNLLTAEQQQLAVRFAGARPSWVAFNGVELNGQEPPVLVSALSAAVCRLVWLKRAGDHTLVLAEVEMATVGDGRPLVWHGSGYHRLAG